MLQFLLSEDQHQLEDISYKSFGVNLVKSGKFVQKYPDITFEKRRAEIFIQQLNDFGASEVHVKDLIFDWIE